MYAHSPPERRSFLIIPDRNPMEQNDVYGFAGVAGSSGSGPSQTSKQQKPHVCPILDCGISCKRRQDLDRHFQSAHLPYWIFCSTSGCQWRGDRVDKLQSHLSTHDNGQSPPAEEQGYQIYNVKMVLSWIKDAADDDTISSAQEMAVELVKERALELGKQEWLVNPWGGSGRGREH